ncbi:hypothetical protein DOY81_010624 [Sarcophaga bullata]|nr:hypothetical protein DOY81_010624 [Sarcophaga bullata]
MYMCVYICVWYMCCLYMYIYIVPSLSEDPTPLAEVNNLNFELESDKYPPYSPMNHDADVGSDGNGDGNEFSEDLLKTPSAVTTLPTTTATTTQIVPSEQEEQLAKDNATKNEFKAGKMFTSTPINKVTVVNNKTEESGRAERVRKGLKFPEDYEQQQEQTEQTKESLIQNAEKESNSSKENSFEKLKSPVQQLIPL